VPEYKLSKRAGQDLTVIWNFSIDRWGETQADDYLQTLHAAIQLLAENLHQSMEVESHFP
jgi:plasmid stabilization system protein ParE